MLLNRLTENIKYKNILNIKSFLRLQISLIAICIPQVLVADSLSALEQQSNQCEFKVAWTDFPPYMFSEEDKPSGAQIELVSWVGQQMDCKINFVETTWKEGVAGVKNGSIDILGRASINPEREKFAYFSLPYREEVLVLTIRRGESQSLQFKDLESLFKRGFRLGILRGGYFGKEVEALYNNPSYKKNFFESPREADLLSALKNGDIDGFFEEPFIIDSAMMTKSLYTEFEEYPIEMLVGKVHFMFSKKTVSLEKVERFNKALREVKNSNRYKQHWYWSTISTK